MLVDERRDELIRLSDAIWRHAETSLEETRSAEVLAGYLERNGFTVERGVAGMPTAFVATWGSGEPVIARCIATGRRTDSLAWLCSGSRALRLRGTYCSMAP